jgi:voltage-gated potassium channel Kch
MRMGMGAALLFYIAILVLLALVKQHRISMDTILGGINVYLLFAVGFAYLHGLVEFSQAGSYQQHGESLSVVFGRDLGGEGLHTFLYFSMITLTTLGYGDISPVSPIARTLCSVEAVVGQLYVAIFIARLVALQASRGGRDRSG